MGGYEHRPAAGGELVEEFHHLLRACGIEGVRWFIEDEDRRLHREDAGNSDPFLLTAGEVVRRPLLVAPEPDVAERVPDRPPDGIGREAEVHRPEGHVLLDSRGDDLDVGVLEDEPDPAAEVPETPVVVGERPAVKADLARGGPEHAVEHQQERRLPGAVRADEGGLRTGGYPDAHPGEGGRAVWVGVGDVVGFKQRCCHANTGPPVESETQKMVPR